MTWKVGVGVEVGAADQGECTKYWGKICLKTDTDKMSNSSDEQIAVLPVVRGNQRQTTALELDEYVLAGRKDRLHHWQCSTARDCSARSVAEQVGTQVLLTTYPAPYLRQTCQFW